MGFSKLSLKNTFNTLLKGSGKVSGKKLPWQRENRQIDGQILWYDQENPKRV